MGEAPGLQSIDLLAHASIAALAKVGLTPADVDGAFTGMPFDLISGLSVPEYFGIHPRITDNNRTGGSARSEEHTSELQSLMRISSAVFCLKKNNTSHNSTQTLNTSTTLHHA